MALPDGFLTMIEKHELLAPLASSLLSAPDVSIRLNPKKSVLVDGTFKKADFADENGNAIAESPVPWCPEGIYLSARPQFTFDPALHQGMYYVQDASSMSIASVVKELSSRLGNPPLLYLDACAAPGGKTTAAISSLPADSYVIANEYDFRRAEILAENVAKWGYPNVAVTRGDTAKLRKAKEIFDIVAVDAPCSGEGMMRKEPKAAEQWSEGLIAQCVSLQREILENAWSALKPGGFLIYSTCTFNLQEDESNLSWLIDTFGGESVSLDCLEAHAAIAHGIDTLHHCYRFLPGRLKGEGLFIAAVRKSGDHTPHSLRPTPRKAKKDAINLENWLQQKGNWDFTSTENEIYAIPSMWANAVKDVLKCTNALMPGLHVASVKGKDIIPAHELALSLAIDNDAFAVAEVDRATAIKYLQREAIAIDNAPKGYVLLTHNGLNLGFVKNLGSRANNLYPKHWRIRTSM